MRCRRVEVIALDRHRVDPRRYGQALAQGGEVAVRITIRRDALVDLQQVDAIPGDVLACQCPQHTNRRAAAAQRQREAATLGDRAPGAGGDETRGLDGSRIGVGENAEIQVAQLSFSTCPPN